MRDEEREDGRSALFETGAESHGGSGGRKDMNILESIDGASGPALSLPKATRGRVCQNDAASPVEAWEQIQVGDTTIADKIQREAKGGIGNLENQETEGRNGRFRCG